MACNTIITIGRQYGSGGREIGSKLAKSLDIKFYDNELLDRAAKDSGICQELFENHDEKPSSSFLYSLVMDTYSMGYSAAALSGMPINHKVFLAQFNAIKEIANEGPCVMVGRCADYALEDYKNVLNVFIYGDMDARIKRIAQRRNLTDAKAKDAIQKTDKQRASYYNYYTSKRWGDIASYDLCINSGILGIDGTVDFLCDYVRKAEEHR
ncbi:MAG: cytidylate kinase-like family protein [Eubacteriales bacterium]|nr:cytidylate kinase-like family protein [Eubacteriales bacterium]